MGMVAQGSCSSDVYCHNGTLNYQHFNSFIPVVIRGFFKISPPLILFPNDFFEINTQGQAESIQGGHPKGGIFG